MITDTVSWGKVEQPDVFGPEWFIGFSVAPVVKNIFAGWFK